MTATGRRPRSDPMRYVLLAAGLPALLASAGGAADWPQYLGGPLRDATSTERVVEWPPNLVWERLVGDGEGIGEGYSSVVVHSGCVYAMGHVPGAENLGTDTVRCLDAATGDVLWTYSYESLSKKGNFGGDETTLPQYPTMGEYGPRATPAADGEIVLTLSADGHLFCFDALTGEVLWYRNVEDHFGAIVKSYGCCSSPLLYGDRAILDLGFRLVALGKADGSVLWECATRSSGFNSPSPVLVDIGGEACVLLGDKTIYCVEVDTGHKLWEYSLGTTAIATHLVSGDKVFFSTYPDAGKCSLLQMSASGAQKVWENQSVMTYFLNNVITGGYLYAMDNTDTEWSGHDDALSAFKCVNLTDGTVEWSQAGMGWAYSVVAGDEILILKETGELVRVTPSPSAYSKDATRAQAVDPLAWTAPALAEGRLYCRNYKGDLRCLSIAPAVSIEATDPVALETGDAGTFTVRRISGDVTAPLTVSLSVTDDKCAYALSADGTPVTNSVEILADQDSVVITVQPQADGDTDDGTVAVAVSQSPDSYVVAADGSATVHVLEALAAPEVTIQASGADKWALEGGPDTGAFTVARSQAAAWPLVVNVTVTPAPAGYTDYTLTGVSSGGTVTIPAGATEVTLALRALDDADQTDATVTVEVVSGSGYTFGTPSNDLVNIVDDDGALSDADGDTMDDDWEKCYWGDAALKDGAADSDGDGLPDAEEYAAGTDPTDEDTDNDGSRDDHEVAAATDPTDPTSYCKAPSDGGGGGCRAAETSVFAGAGAGAALALVALAWMACRVGGPLVSRGNRGRREP